jgi:hypothetical protein
MKTHFRVAGLVVLAALLGLLAGGDRGMAQKGGNLVWKPVVPNKEAKDLVKQSLAAIQKETAGLAGLNGKELKIRMNGIRASAIALAAVIQSTPGLAKDRKLATLRDALLTLSQHAQAYNLITVGGLGAQLGNLKPNPAANLAPVAVRNFLADPEFIMAAMKVKKKGGEGLHPNLHTVPILATLARNGIEEKIKCLRRRKLTNAQMKKEAEQLALLAYKVAALGQLADDWSPNVRQGRGLKNPRNWQRLSKDMRNDAVQLAIAAGQGKPNAVLAAAKRLDDTCTRCHKVFK